MYDVSEDEARKMKIRIRPRALSSAAYMIPAGTHHARQRARRLEESLAEARTSAEINELRQRAYQQHREKREPPFRATDTAEQGTPFVGRFLR